MTRSTLNRYRLYGGWFLSSSATSASRLRLRIISSFQKVYHNSQPNPLRTLSSQIGATTDIRHSSFTSYPPISASPLLSCHSPDHGPTAQHGVSRDRTRHTAEIIRPTAFISTFLLSISQYLTCPAPRQIDDPLSSRSFKRGCSILSEPPWPPCPL